MKKLPVLLFAFVVFAAIAVPVASRTEAATVSDSYHLFSAVPSTASFTPINLEKAWRYAGPLDIDLCYSSIDSAVISSNPEGTGGIVVDNYILVNGQSPCGDSCFDGIKQNVTLEGGHDITELEDPTKAPVDVKDKLVKGTNTFELWDWGGIYGNTDLYLVVSGTCNQDPVCSNATPSNGLWPPQHQMVSVGVLGVTDPDGDPVTITIDSVYQDEVLNGLGDGNTAPDAVIHGGTVDLRAERDGTANGRIYYINFTASDGKGGTCSGTVEVGVNHDQGKKGEAVGEGPLYPQTQPSVAPGNSGNAHDNSGNNPGNSGNAHDNSGNNPGNSGNPPGQDKNQDQGKSNEEHGKKK